MGVPRLLHLKKLIPLPTKTIHLNSHLQVRKCATQPSTATSDSDNDVCSKVVLHVARSPNSSVTPLLDQYVPVPLGGDTKFPYRELQKIIRLLRTKNCFGPALEVSKWMTSKTHGRQVDFAVQLDLIDKVHGPEAAERYFNEVNDHSEKMYVSLLNCYAKRNLVDESLSLFKKMKDNGLATSPLTYNCIMTLYLNTGEVEKIPEVLVEMENNGVSPDDTSYNICLKSYGVRSDFTNMEILVKLMENQPQISIDWFTYVRVANYFIEGGGQMEKVLYYLKKTEDKLHENHVGYNHLITTYAKLGDLTQVMRLWQKHKAVCKAQKDDDYVAIIGSLVKLDELQEAERLLEEWESSCEIYNFRVPNVLLSGCAQKGLVENAESMLERITSNGRVPVPSTWSIMCGGFIKSQNMEKALQCMKNALELVPQHPWWLPKPEFISTILIWLGDNGDIEVVDEFLNLLSRVVPMDQEMYKTLMKANVRHGNEIESILQRMKADNIDVDEETSNVLQAG